MKSNERRATRCSRSNERHTTRREQQRPLMRPRSSEKRQHSQSGGEGGRGCDRKPEKHREEQGQEDRQQKQRQARGREEGRKRGRAFATSTRGPREHRTGSGAHRTDNGSLLRLVTRSELVLIAIALVCANALSRKAVPRALGLGVCFSKNASLSANGAWDPIDCVYGPEICFNTVHKSCVSTKSIVSTEANFT